MPAREPAQAGPRKLTREAGRLGSTTARLKLKGIDGKAHKQGSVWFNSSQNERPHQGSTFYRLFFWKQEEIRKDDRKAAAWPP